VDHRQSAITGAAAAKKAAQEVDKLLQNQRVKRVSLQTKCSRRRGGVKNGVYRLCVTVMNQMKKALIAPDA